MAQDCSSSAVNIHPSLLFILMLEILLELVNSRKILYIRLVSILVAAYCASAPFDYIQCLLSVLRLFPLLCPSLCILRHVVSTHVSLLSNLVYSLHSSVHLSGHMFPRKSTSPCCFPFSSPNIWAICDAAHKHLPVFLKIRGMFLICKCVPCLNAEIV